MSDLIKAGDTVVIRLHDEKSCYVTKVEGSQKVGRTRVNMKNMIGRPYGSIFEIQHHQIQYIPGDNASIIDEFINADVITGGTQVEQEKGDNRGYADTNSAQKLKYEDIKQMRESGVSGTEIIQNLISNSETWGSKTAFAQEKWMKKKQQKYTKRFRVLKATPASICEVYNNKNPEKICSIRGDLLAQLIYQSGVRAGGNLLVFESMLGLIVGTAAYKMRGVGRIYAAYEGQQPHFEIVNCLNLSVEDADIIQPVPAAELAPAADHVLSHGFYPHNTRSAPTMPGSGNYGTKKVPTDTSSSNTSNTADAAEGPDMKRARSDNKVVVETSHLESESDAQCISESVDDQAPVRRHNTSGRQVAVLEHTRRILRSGFNSLIIASRFHPLPVLKECLPLLGPNSPFAIYCEYMEPLTECYLYLQHRGDCLRMRLCDTWLREYQTLPGRVHPQMFMPVSGGYLLAGVYVGMSGMPKE